MVRVVPYVASISALASFALGAPSSSSPKTINTARVATNAIAIASHSWEYGALTQALIELDSPLLSPLSGPGSIPPPTHNNRSTIPAGVWTTVLNIMANVSSDSDVLIDGDGAAGDPASVGPAVLLANTVQHNASWTSAVKRQLDHLLYDVPRSADGGISQRESEVQFWADFVYMVPPFLAYYGALEANTANGTALLREAHKQCQIYRAALFDADVSLWRHIVFGSFQLNQHWGTGNAWAAYGMMRVLATIHAVPSAAKEMQSEQQDLVNWINEILVGAYKFQKTNGTLFNYIDQPASQTFADSAGTALIAAATYRLATFTGNKTFIPQAEKAYKLISESIDSSGWVLNAVDPLTFDTPLAPGEHSPEAQSFALMLQAARNAFHS